MEPKYVQDKYYKPTDVQDKYFEMDIFESITFGFLMTSLDTLYLKEFLPHIPSSNRIISYIVGNIIP
jgi:hypothetical protein